MRLDWIHSALITLAAVFSGAVNAIAGGGGIISFLTLLSLQVSPIYANATNTLSLWPGILTSTWEYKKNWKTFRNALPIYLFIAFLGGLIGSFLLLKINAKAFNRLVPYLILISTILFAGSKWFLKKWSYHKTTSQTQGVVFFIFLFLCAVYGGFFGGSVGILLIILLSLSGLQNIHEINALKNLLSSCINSIAVFAFVIKGIIIWELAILMIIGSVVGGYIGAYYGQKINPKYIRGIIIVTGLFLGIYFLIHPSK